MGSVRPYTDLKSKYLNLCCFNFDQSLRTCLFQITKLYDGVILNQRSSPLSLIMITEVCTWALSIQDVGPTFGLQKQVL